MASSSLVDFSTISRKRLLLTPLTRYLRCIHAFTIDLALHVKGVPNHLQTIRTLQEKYPNFRPFEGDKVSELRLILANEENEDNESERCQ